MSLGFVIAASCSIILGFVTYYLWIWTYWMRKGVKGPRGKPFVGVLDVLLDHEKPGLLQLSEWTKKYGKVYGITDGTQKTLIISDFSMVHQIFNKQHEHFYGRKLNPLQGNPETDPRVHLLAAQGGRWKRLRAISGTCFTTKSMRKIMGTVEDSALELLRHIEEKTAGGRPIDMLTFYQEYTMDVIGRIAMGQSTTQMFKNPLSDLIKKVFCGDRKNILLFCQVFPTFGYMIRDLTFKFSGKIPAFTLYTVVRDAVYDRIAQRKKDTEKGAEPGEPQDFIDLFLDAWSEEFIKELSAQDMQDFSSQNLTVTKTLSTDEVVGQCFVFLIGGFDTTALSLSYVTYCLATNPEVQRKCQEEVDREFGDNEVEYDKLGRLRYMDCVIKEALRMYPLASISNSRKCMHTTTVKGIKIEAGTYVQMDTWSLHYDTSIWGEDAKEFKPERWTSSDDKFEHKGAYLPFGLGLRQCIGMRLAIMEQKVLLTHILKKYSFETGPKTTIPLKLVGSATTSPEDVFVHLTSRHV